VQVKTPGDLDGALAAIEKTRPDVLLTVLDGLTFQLRGRIVEFANKSRLPAMYESSAFVDGGGLISYGPRLIDNYVRAAGYVDRILKGAKPGDLPVELPTRFELVVNQKTARSLGIAIPSAVLLRSDRVVE
jgi:putative ABC transport system substrate-binding protein